jgi:hypothetical protein
MIHVKPSRRQTWGYHAIRAWYFAPALNHYRCIKAVTEAGAIRTSDTFKFLHHSLPAPIISNTDRIVKATQHLVRTIEGHSDAPPDELQAIQHLRDLITGAAAMPTEPEPRIDPPNDPDPADEIEPDLHPIPIQIAPDPIHTIPPAADKPSHLPNTIPFNDDEYETPAEPEPRYHLRSHNHIVMSAIELVGEANA